MSAFASRTGVLAIAALLTGPARAQAPGSASGSDAELAEVPARASARESAAAARPRILYLGMDGADLGVVKALLAAKKLPNLAKLAAAGSLGILHSHEPTRSPAVWTTLATGTRKEKHGIYDYVTSSWYYPKEIRTKAKRLSTSAMRKSPALWNLLEAAGKTTVTVGWLSTWPAEKTRGAVVAPYIDLGSSRQTTIKGAIYRTKAPQQTADPKLFSWLKPHLKAPADFEGAYLRRYLDPLPEHDPLFETLSILRRYPYTVAWTGARMHNNTESALRLAKRFDPDLLMVYYQCPDSLGHRFWLARQPVEAIRERLSGIGADPARAEEIARRFGKVIDVCYAEIDAQLGRLLKVMGKEPSVIIASDHGFGDCERGCMKKNVPWNGGHRDDGLLLLAGPAFSGARPKDPWVEDLPVTVLDILGVPAPADVDGRVLRESLAP